MLERLSEATIRLFSAIASIPKSTMGDNAAPPRSTTTITTTTTTAHVQSSTACRRFALLYDLVTATTGYPPSTSWTDANPALQFEAELQPWSYRRASDKPKLEAVKREQREQKARRAREAWRKFWT